MTNIRTKQGENISGILISETTQGVVVDVSKTKTIKQEKQILKKDIRRREDETIIPKYTKAMMQISLHDNEEASPEQCRQAIALFDEYIRKVGDKGDLTTIQAKRKAFELELAGLEAGDSKVNGEWLPPVEAAVAKYDAYGETAAKSSEEKQGAQ